MIHSQISRLPEKLQTARSQDEGNRRRSFADARNSGDAEGECDIFKVVADAGTVRPTNRFVAETRK